MSEDSMMKACYRCVHRGSVPGSVHSSCKHPKASILENRLSIQANMHGINRGWFDWPVNFDPVWLEHCDGFKENTQ